MLTLLYASRALAFAMFLAVPLSWLSVLLFAASLGFLWLGTVPLTSGLVSYMFGSTHMSMLLGIVFFSHQVGSFLGGWGAGRLYDIQGSYELYDIQGSYELYDIQGSYELYDIQGSYCLLYTSPSPRDRG